MCKQCILYNNSLNVTACLKTVNATWYVFLGPHKIFVSVVIHRACADSCRCSMILSVQRSFQLWPYTEWIKEPSNLAATSSFLPHMAPSFSKSPEWIWAFQHLLKQFNIIVTSQKWKLSSSQGEIELWRKRFSGLAYIQLSNSGVRALKPG